MMNERIRELTLDEWKGHIFMMAAWICEADDVQIKDVMEYYLKRGNLHLEDEYDDVIMNLYVKSKLERMIGGKMVKRMNVAKVLTGYYDIIKENSAGYIIGRDEVKELLKQNFLKFMEEKNSKQDAINVIALNGNDLNEFVKANCIIKRNIEFGGDQRFTYNNLIVDEVIDYFGSYVEKSFHLKEAQELYNPNKNGRYKTLPDILPTNMDKEKFMVFGTDFKYREFLTKCFVDRSGIDAK